VKVIVPLSWLASLSKRGSKLSFSNHVPGSVSASQTDGRGNLEQGGWEIQSPGYDRIRLQRPMDRLAQEETWKVGVRMRSTYFTRRANAQRRKRFSRVGEI
jgi:hypothetical protein